MGSLQAVAQWFRVDARTVHNWKNNGMPCREGGGYDLRDITAWRIQRAESRTASAGGDRDIEQEEFLKLQAERQTKQAKLAQILGKLVDRSVVAAMLMQFAAMVRSRLQAIPGELASSIPPEFRHDLMIDLEQKIVLILTEMNAWSLPQSLEKKTEAKPAKNGGSKSSRSKTSGTPRAGSSRRGKSRSG